MVVIRDFTLKQWIFFSLLWTGWPLRNFHFFCNGSSLSCIFFLSLSQRRLLPAFLFYLFPLFFVVVIFHFYIQYRHYNTFKQKDITHTILVFYDLDTSIHIYAMNVWRTWLCSWRWVSYIVSCLSGSPNEQPHTIITPPFSLFLFCL